MRPRPPGAGPGRRACCRRVSPKTNLLRIPRSARTVRRPRALNTRAPSGLRGPGRHAAHGADRDCALVAGLSQARADKARAPRGAAQRGVEPGVCWAGRGRDRAGAPCLYSKCRHEMITMRLPGVKHHSPTWSTPTPRPAATARGPGSERHASPRLPQRRCACRTAVDAHEEATTRSARLCTLHPRLGATSHKRKPRREALGQDSIARVAGRERRATGRLVHQQNHEFAPASPFPLEQGLVHGPRKPN